MWICISGKMADWAHWDHAMPLQKGRGAPGRPSSAQWSRAEPTTHTWPPPDPQTSYGHWVLLSGVTRPARRSTTHTSLRSPNENSNSHPAPLPTNSGAGDVTPAPVPSSLRRGADTPRSLWLGEPSVMSRQLPREGTVVAAWRACSLLCSHDTHGRVRTVNFY